MAVSVTTIASLLLADLNDTTPLTQKGFHHKQLKKTNDSFGKNGKKKLFCKAYTI